VLLAILVTATLPAGARAAVFYVNSAATTPQNPCTDPAPANACKHVMDAVTQARSTFGGDMINIATGTYAEVVKLDNDADAGDTLNGAGIPSTGHPGTTIGYPNASSEQTELWLGRFTTPLIANISVKNLRVAVADAPSAPDGFVAVLMASSNGQLSNIEVDDAHSDATSGAGVVVAVGPTTIDRAEIHTTGAADSALVAETVLGPVTLRDSLLSALVGGLNTSAIQLARGTLDVQRTRAVGGSATLSLQTANTQATLDSVVLTRGVTAGIQLTPDGAGIVGTVLARHVTVDAGMPGVEDPPGVSSVVAQAFNGAQAIVTLLDSIAVDRVTDAGGATITCTTTDLPPGGPCDPAANGNSSSAPSDLFPNGTSADYRLSPTAPVIDTGSPLLPGDESSTDILGNPRVLDGNFDCVVASDKGANEVTGQENTPPTATASGPATAEAGVPASFTATGSDAQDDASLLTFNWSFSDGLTGSGASIAHAFAPLGAQSATITVADTHGCAATATQGLTVADTTAPVLSKLSLSHSTFRAGGKGASASRKKKKKPKGTTIKLTLSEPAKLTFTIVKRHKTKVLGTLKADGKTGANSIKFNGKAKHKALKRGSYDLRVDAKDPSANKAKRHTLHFKITR